MAAPAPLLPAGDDLGAGTRAKFLAFLQKFVLDDAAGGTTATSDATDAAARARTRSRGGSASARTAVRAPHYVAVLTAMVDAQETTLQVLWPHLEAHDGGLADAIRSDHLRLAPFLRAAVADFVAAHAPEYAVNEVSSMDGSVGRRRVEGGREGQREKFGGRRAHQTNKIRRPAAHQKPTLPHSQDDVPREFWVAFHALPHVERLRDLRTARVGKLTAFAGTVTRASDVRPELFLGAFRCAECGATVRGVEQHFKYTEPLVCPAPTCGNRTKWSLLKELSTFVDWQRLRVQEAPDEVPPGSLPRTVEVVLRGDAVDCARPGDRSVFAGDLVAVPDVAALSAPGERVEARRGGGASADGDGGVTGPRFLGVRELTYRLAFVACSVEDASARAGGAGGGDAGDTPDDVLASLAPCDRADVAAMAANPRVYADLAASIAPSVAGHDDVKRSVLLQLLGGVHKTTADGAALRGDINVAIVGDPSTAKSQFLKYVASFLPRAVYTSGRSSSAAGLTASVVREADTGELAIEAGALMLANGAVCCIDEFDKMDVKDQVAIHEAMEQQTISITKAGIQATLAARTSILAAANPAGGRYDPAKPLRYNVALPPAILSRFDLLHVMVDVPDPAADAAVAAHIVRTHQARAGAAGDGTGVGGAAPTAAPAGAPYTTAQLQRYVRYARAHAPRLTRAARTAIVDGYRRLRASDAAPGSSAAYRVTVRQLEALVRLSEAVARARLASEVTAADAREAARLVRDSISDVEAPPEELEDEDEDGGGGGGGEGDGGAAAAPPPRRHR